MMADPTRHTTNHNHDEEEEHGTHADTDSPGDPSGTTTRTPRHRPGTTPKQKRTPFVSRINPESRAYWKQVVAKMEPMTREEIADVAVILRRIDARIAARERGENR